MTTGIPPFMNMKFTENKLRLEHGVPLRTSYTQMCQTAHYQTVSRFDGGKGIWPEHVQAWDEWKNKNPKQAGKDADHHQEEHVLQSRQDHLRPLTNGGE